MDVTAGTASGTGPARTPHAAPAASVWLRALRTVAVLVAGSVLVVGGSFLLRGMGSGVRGGGAPSLPAPSLRAVAALPSPTVAPSSPAPTAGPGPSGEPAPSGPPTPTPGPSGPPGRSSPPARLLAEVEVAGPPAPGPTNCQGAFEPIVATHPFDPRTMAVVYNVHVASASAASTSGSAATVCEAVPELAISTDRGRSWRLAASNPWRAVGRFPNHHAAIAWGPGPRPGSARLYLADITYGSDGGRLTVTWSDDAGATWSPPYVERRVPPWIAGFPDIAVDRDPASPDYGAVYVAWNWFASAVTGPGLHVIASVDFGASWQGIEVPPAARSATFPASWRIANRLVTAPDGTVFLTWYEIDLRHWDPAHPWATGGWSNIGPVGLGLARLRFDPTTGRLTRGTSTMALALPRTAASLGGLAPAGTTDVLFTDPAWGYDVAVDASTGRLFLAVTVFGSGSRSGNPAGGVRLGRSDDGGETWTWIGLPALPRVNGHAQSSFRPSLVAAGGRVVVGLHGITDVPAGTSPRLAIPTIGTYVEVSIDGGATFEPPVAASSARWNAAALTTYISGPGLRDRAALTADGVAVFVTGDGRFARPLPDPRAGRSAIFAAIVALPPVEAAGPQPRSRASD